MKKKLDMYLIYLIYIFELIYTMSAMYFNNSIVTHKIEIFENIYQIAYCMIFIVGILYILLLIYKVGHHESIDLNNIFIDISCVLIPSCFPNASIAPPSASTFY